MEAWGGDVSAAVADGLTMARRVLRQHDAVDGPDRGDEGVAISKGVSFHEDLLRIGVLAETA